MRHQTSLQILVGIGLVLTFVIGCAPSATPTPIPPTSTPIPTETATPSPQPTATQTETAQPTATPPPTTTSTPASDTTVVKTMDFSSDCPYISDNSNRTFGCENGEYTILSKVVNKAWWMNVNGVYDDTVIEVDAHSMSGTADVDFGIIFRTSTNGSNFYYFAITQNGYYNITYHTPSNWKDLIPYTESSVIKKGNETNHLKVLVQKNQIAVFANGQLLGSVTDSSLSSGEVGLLFGSAEANSKVVFDNLSIAKINRPLALPTSGPPNTLTAAQWNTTDLTVIARTLSDSAKTYLPQMQQVKTLLAQTPVNCAQVVPLLDALAQAPRYEEMANTLWQRTHQGPTGQGAAPLWNVRDAYGEGINRMRDDKLSAIRNACAGGAQPANDQRLWASGWMDYSISKMEFTIEQLRLGGFTP